MPEPSQGSLASHVWNVARLGNLRCKKGGAERRRVERSRGFIHFSSETPGNLCRAQFEMAGVTKLLCFTYKKIFASGDRRLAQETHTDFGPNLASSGGL